MGASQTSPYRVLTFCYILLFIYFPFVVGDVAVFFSFFLRHVYMSVQVLENSLSNSKENDINKKFSLKLLLKRNDRNECRNCVKEHDATHTRASEEKNPR